MKRRIPASLLAATVLLLALSPALALAGSAPQRAQVHAQVWQALQADGETEVLVVLRAQADLRGAATLPTREAKGRYVYERLLSLAQRSQRDLRAALDAQGAEYQAFYIVNALKVRADSALVRFMAARPDVKRIVPNPWVQGIPRQSASPVGATPAAIEPNLVRVGADAVWALGYTGQGTVVAGNDTGIQWDHPALIDQYREAQPGYGRHDYNWHDAIDNLPVPYDDHSHGTHTLGTIVGDDGEGNQIGMAPGARWIGCKNMSSSGYGSPATYLECFQFLLAPYAWNDPASADPALAPDVVNNSWSCPPLEGCDAGTLEAAVEALRQAGIAVVVSAGNTGSSCSTVDNPPALYRQSFTVGAFDHNTDLIAGFSSRGPVTYGGETYLKPDITAPGVLIRSSVPVDRYTFNQGTSMAGPHVAGAVALLLSAAPGYRGQVDAIEYLLTRTAEPKLSSQCGDPGPPNNVWGWGILDALDAVAVATAGSLRGAVTEAGSGAPIGGARVTATLDLWPAVEAEAMADATGHYTLTLAAGTYTVTVGAKCYVRQTLAGVVVDAGEVTPLDVALAPAWCVYLPVAAREPQVE
jgi:serine protease AprX